MRRITKGNNTNQNETNRRKAFSRYHTTYVTIFYHWPMSRLNSQLIITCCDNVVTIRCALDSWYIQLPPESAGSDSQYSRLQWEVIWMWSNSLWISIKLKRERKKFADSSPLCHMNTANRSTPEFIPSRHSRNNLYNTVSNCDIIICTAWNLFSALYKNISLLSSLNASNIPSCLCCYWPGIVRNPIEISCVTPQIPFSRYEPVQREPGTGIGW